jgi:formate-dependent nitrite reductase cytochrome c552 subunit
MLRDLRRVPCTDCGQRYEPFQMDFDHRDPSTKLFTLMTGRAMLMSTAKLLAEVAKCDIVCANCHRDRTYQRIQARRSEVSLLGRSLRIARMRAYWRAHQRLLNDLRSVPCSDCNRQFAAHVMEFDHRDPSIKVASVSSLIGRAGEARIRQEASKCDVVCTNCHRMRTYLRREAPSGGRSSVG